MTLAAGYFRVAHWGNRFYALDDRSDHPRSPEEHAQFVPVITLGKGSAWLHGKRYAGGGRRSKVRIVLASTTLAR